MWNRDTPSWQKCALGLAVAVLVGVVSAFPDIALPSPQDRGWTPLVGLAHAIVVGIAFSLLLTLANKIWSDPSRENRRIASRIGKRPFLVFLVFAGGDFAVEVSARPLASWLSGHPNPEQTVARLVEAGGGWFLPLTSLAIFIGVWAFRRRRAH